VAARVTIGEFSTMTRLTRKALRIYHDQGLLEPADVDPATGYRYYDVTQVETARLIRRFRDLDMPVPDLLSYVAATDDEARHAILSAHLDHMEKQLLQTQEAVAALRALITPADPPIRIEIRRDETVLAAAITETVRLDDIAAWWHGAARELDDALRTAGVVATGPLGGLYEHALFSDEEGQATLWFPIEAGFPKDAPVPDRDRVTATHIPGGAFAVAIHDGPDARIDETYAALGSYAATHGISRDGPLRERYLAGALDDAGPLITEVAWPVTE
jgi:DNA-binding transcriptional MerR regulator/effector-binding domain-containing protein